MRYLMQSCGVIGFVAISALGLAACGPSGSSNQTQVTPTAAQQTAASANPGLLVVPLRKSINQLTPAELASLRKGIAQMIAWNNEPRGSANFKRSLRYWANMHAFIGINCSPNSGINNQGMSGLSIQSKQTPDENATWCTCQHGTIQFLTWHRMYLYYFEKVLQAAAGDPNLRLPYWDYETDGHIPAAYRDPTYVNGNGQTVPNPLYIPNRQASLNNGSATLSPAVVSTAGAMPATTYSPFNSAIEQTPHGSVHCATGVNSCPTGYMGYVPSAGNDPIFYSHHANIDRLYECWVKVAPAQRLPSGATLNATFNFIDGAGNLVNRKVGDMLTTQQLGYNYTAGGGCPAVAKPPIVVQQLPSKVIDLAGPVELQTGVTSVPVKLPAPVRSSNESPDAQPAQQATLVLEGVTFDQAPGAMFEVALQAANGKRVTIGVINFFNQSAPHQGNMESGGAPAENRSFDASAALQALGAGAAGARLVLKPTSGVSGANTDVAPTVKPGAKVRFSAAKLELR
jgi:Common central domain of tyrosinase/Polyphenol oxidase middle domain